MIDYESLKNWKFAEIEQRYEARDTILYALGVGLGADPVDPAQLRFVYEEGLLALPTLATVLAPSRSWLRDPATGVDYTRVVHGEQGLVIHRPLAAAGTVRGSSKVDEIIDKGAGRGALLYSSRELRDAAGALLATLTSTTFCRGDGGFGGPSGPTRPPHPIPERTPDLTTDLPTVPQQALLYRLNGDLNPLHADPAAAAKAGFPRPILHGLSTYGLACHAIVRTLCGYDPARLRGLDVRFSAPVFPGETVRTELWRESATLAAFRCTVVERSSVVIDNGRAELFTE